jgi:enoyl-[acyl-carrier protein] reductase I
MLAIDLSGKRAFVAGVADDSGFGFAIAKALAQAGASVCVGTWPPALGIFEALLRRGKLDASLQMSDGGKLELERIYPLDAEYDSLEDAPQELREQKRYRDRGDFSIDGVASRLREDGALLALSYLASQGVVADYGGGMASAKAALETDTRMLAFEMGRQWGHRVNVISAGPYASRAASAIGFIHKMIRYYEINAPLPDALRAEEVGNAAAFLCSPLASGITGTVLYVDKGYHAMAAPADVEGLVDSLSRD